MDVRAVPSGVSERESAQHASQLRCSLRTYLSCKHHNGVLPLQHAQANSKSQESVSESVNAYYGAYLLSTVLGMGDVADYCRILLATEILGAQFYWQIPESEAEAKAAVYPSEFAAANRMVGVVGGTTAVASTWFGSESKYSNGINMLPFTPVSEALLRPGFVRGQMEALAPVMDTCAATDPWLGILLEGEAIIDPVRVWHAVVDGGRVQVVDAGSSVADVLYWVATRGGW